MWTDKPSEELSLEEARKAVKDLRKAYSDLLAADQNLKQELCEIKNVKHYWQVGKEEWKTTYDKPPLGCRPPIISCVDRIAELSQAITRQTGYIKVDFNLIKKWATEILYQIEIIDKCR